MISLTYENTLEICNSSQKAINVPGASLVPVSSTFDIIQLMDIGLRNRAIGSTAMNDRSSRSHRYIFNPAHMIYIFL